MSILTVMFFFFFFQAEDGIRDLTVTGVQTCALPICAPRPRDESAELRPGPVQLPLAVPVVRPAVLRPCLCRRLRSTEAVAGERGEGGGGGSGEGRSQRRGPPPPPPPGLRPPPRRARASPPRRGPRA